MSEEKLTAELVLRKYQRQIDEDGTDVGVSRQALDEVLGELTSLRAKLSEVERGLEKAKEFAKKYCAPHFQEYMHRLEAQLSEREAQLAAVSLVWGNVRSSVLCLIDQACNHGPDDFLATVREMDRLKLSLPAQAKKILAVVEAAKGFRDHGEAKNGTHAKVMFDALAALQESKP